MTPPASTAGADDGDLPLDEERLELGLQAERTLLAWTRTALSFVVAGALVVKSLVAADTGAVVVGAAIAVVVAGTAGAAVVGVGAGRRVGSARAGSVWPVRALAAGTAAMALLVLAVELVSGTV